jgi:HEPN domain-containing protein
MQLDDKAPEYWYFLASQDEESAEILRREQGPLGICAYHYHQAAEKKLKGAILAARSVFPYIHDLRRLYGILRIARPDLPDLADPIEELQSAYTDLRYPREGARQVSLPCDCFVPKPAILAPCLPLLHPLH